MIFVTGSTGLIGSHLLYHLTHSGHRVRALIRSPKGEELLRQLFQHYTPNPDSLLERIEWVYGDITDFATISERMQGVEYVYHCAAMVAMGGTPLQEILEVNVNGTANMVNASLAHGVKGFCHVSSIASLGGTSGTTPADESSEWGKSKGKSAYAISKFRSEMEVWLGIEQGLKATIVNPSVVLGPCNWGKGSGRILGAISKGLPFYTLGVTGYVDVRDVVGGMIAAMDKECWGKRYILSSENLSHREVFASIALAMGKKPPRVRVRPWVTRMAWPLAWLWGIITFSEPVITRSTASSGHTVSHYSSERAKKELGIQFRPVSEAVANAIEAGEIDRRER